MSSDLNSQIFLLEVNHPIYPDFQLNFNYYNQFAMTLLVSWIAVDSRAPSSIYVASDSRISWGGSTNYDFGKKVFACKNYPEIFGYCGDVLFPVMMLSQVVDSIDCDLLFSSNLTCKEKTRLVMKRMAESFKRYPSEVENIVKPSFEILHCSRDINQKFSCYKITWEKNRTRKWSLREVKASRVSDKAFILGNGAKEFEKKLKLYMESKNAKTSRSLFQCFCHTLADIEDKSCGGAPQLSGIYRKPDSGGRLYGIIWKKKRFFEGMQVDNYPKDKFNAIEWRNELFEICDGKTKRKKNGAQSQPNYVRDKEATPHAAQNI